MKVKLLSLVAVLTITLGLVGCGNSDSNRESNRSQGNSSVNYNMADLESAIAQAQAQVNGTTEKQKDDYTEISVKNSSTEKIFKLKIPNEYLEDTEELGETSEEISTAVSFMYDYNSLEDSVKIKIASHVYNYDKKQSSSYAIDSICSSVSNEVLVPKQVGNGIACIVRDKKSGKVTAYRYIDCSNDKYYITLACEAEDKCYVKESELLDILYEIKVVYE